MAAIMGIDASLDGTGIAVIPDDPRKQLILNQRIESKKSGVSRLLEIEKEIEDIFDTIKPKIVCLEGYAFAKGYQAHQMGELGGVLRRMLYLKGARVIEVGPSQVKKFATGKGNTKKEMIILNVYKRWSQEFATNDEADAFVLAKIGQVIIAAEAGSGDENKKKGTTGDEAKNGEKDNGEKLTAFQAEVIEALMGKRTDGGGGRGKRKKAGKKKKEKI